MAGFNFRGSLIKAFKKVVDRGEGEELTGDRLKEQVGEKFYTQVNVRVVKLKEYAPTFRKLSALTGVPEKVLYAIAIASGTSRLDEHEREVLEDYARAVATFKNHRGGSWEETVSRLAEEGHLPPLTGRVLSAIDPRFVNSRTPMEKVRLYTDRLEDHPDLKALLSVKKPLFFHTLILDTSGGLKAPKRYHSLFFKKYENPKDNGEVASFAMSLVPEDVPGSIEKGFLLEGENLVGSFRIEEGKVIVQVNGREMSYSRAKNLYPDVSTIVDVALRRAKELGYVVDREEEQRKRDRTLSRRMQGPSL